MTECPNTDMQSFPQQQVIVGILVPANQVNYNYQLPAPPIYAKPMYMNQVVDHVPKQSVSRQQSPETDTTAEDVDVERPRLSTSAARRMRRKRAAERAAVAALEVDNKPLTAGRAPRSEPMDHLGMLT